jgi:hypothetical protein
MVRMHPSREIPAKRLIAAALLSLVLSSCFHTVGRLPFAGEGARETIVDLEAGDVRFAADVEVRYTGRAIARYDVDLLQGDHLVGRATCDPLRITGRRSCVYRFGNHDFDCSIVMECRAHVDAGGPTVVRARLSIPTRPAEFTLHRADLIVGQ